MSLENSQMQQPADLGSEASFGQENISRDIPHDPSDIQSYLRSLKEKHMAEIEKVFQNHQKKLEESEREISNSMREIQIQQIKRKRQQEEYEQQAEKARQEEDNLKRLLNIKPQTVEEIKERVKLQMQLQKKVSSQQNISFSQNQMHQLSLQASKSPQSNLNRKTPMSSKSTGKKKGTLWFYENREKAEFEYALRDYLKQKEKKKVVIPAAPKTFQPIIIKPEERRLYDKVKENEDYELMTPCSDDLSNYAFETGNDILANFQSIFENSEKQSKKQRKRYRVKDFKDDELFLIAYFFSKIPSHVVEGDEEDGDFVTKEDFEQALLNKKEILLLYNIKPEDIHKELLRLSTQKAGYVSLKEAGEFLMRDRQSLSMEHYENIQKLKQDQRETLSVARSLLTEEQVNILRDIFLDIDTFGECKVSLKQMITKVKTDHRTRDWIEKPIAFIKQVDRTILMEDLFSELEQWMSIGKEAERRQKEYVDWDTIKDLFVNYKRKDIPSRDKVFAAQRLLGRYDFGDTIEIPKEFLQIIKTTFENLPKYAQYYVNAHDFIEELINNKQYTFFKTKFVRSKKYIDLEIETVDDVLKRIPQECDVYHTQDEILDFFSRKGRPRYLARKIKQQKHKKILMKKVEKEEEQENNQKDESDDSFELNRDEIKEKRKQRKVAKILKGTEEDAQKQLEKNQFMQQKNFGAQYKSEDDDFIITVPQPFAFDTRDKQKSKSIRQRRLEEMLKEKQDVEDYYVSTATAFRANKIPNHIKDRHLWEKIDQKNQQRREIVKKESKAMTLARENPFSFYYRDLQKVMERKNFQPDYKFDHFKAKHAPWYCRVRLFDRLIEKQREKSRQNVEKRKAELMKGSKLPEGVKSMLQRLKVKDQITEEKRKNRLLEYSFQPPRAKSVPDFANLQKDFEEKLSQKKGEFQPTIPVPFNFQETRKAPTRDYLDKENELVKKTKEVSQKGEREKKLKRILTMKVKYQPPSTKKFEALVAKKRFESEVKQYQKEVTQSREQDKNERRKKFAEFVNSCINNVNYSEYANQLRQQKYQERENRLLEKIQWEQQFDQKMTEMMQNVIRRPLLIEQVSDNTLTTGRAQRLRQILGEGVPIQEESENYEDDDELIIPNFDQMTQMQLIHYLDPHQVDPQTLEIRQQLYTQYLQKKQMPNINEMDEEDEDQHTYQNNQEEYEHEGEENDMDHQEQHEEEERDNEAVNKMNQQYQGDYQQYSKDGQHDAGEDDDEDDFHNNQELIEQQKQVQQIQQQQMDDDEDDDYEIDAGGQPGGIPDDYEKVFKKNSQQQQQQAQNGSKNASVDLKQQSNSFNKANLSSSSQKGASNQVVGAPKQSAGYPQHNQDHEEEEDDGEFDEEQIYDENGQPIPPELLKEYQEQIRRMQEQGEYDEEYDEDDEDEYDENAQYFDENGQLISPEIVRQIKEERKALKQLEQQAYAAGYAQDKQQGKISPGETDSKRSSSNPSLSKQQQAQKQPSQPKIEEQSASKSAAPQQQQQQQPNNNQKDLSKNLSDNQGRLNEQDQDEDEQINEEDLLDKDAEYIDEDGNPLSREQVAQYLKHQKLQQEMGDEADEYLEYCDENGNPLTHEEVKEYMRQQKLLAQQEGMDIDDHDDDGEEPEYVDENGNPLSPEEVQEILRQQKMMGMQHGHEDDDEHDEYDEKHLNSQKDKHRAYADEDDEEFDDEGEEYVDQHGNPIDPEKIKQLKQQEAAAAAAAADVSQKQTQPQPDSKEKQVDNKNLAQKDLPKVQAQQQNVEDEDEEQGEYDDEEGQYEQQFESEQEYIDYLVQMELKKYQAAGKKVSEEEIRQRIEEQLMQEQNDQEQMDALEEQFEEVIAQMSPEDLAKFVDEQGQPLPKEQIKYFLMQEHLQGYDDEEEDEEEYQHQMQMRAAQQKGGSQKDALNSSF